ncbi:DUF488 domain-containing protein [Croceibacterium mercuriale]|uniref:DUF488 domain-containing protein n=1 Tax=Croceibacterium mercuriale TaxID=1572751 RepID=UPI0009E0A0DA|nr:DUF488 domain-containing protein [Croceibacterium mercuriale]
MVLGRFFSIGYGSNTQEAVLERLRLTGVKYLIDVRSMPYSKFQPDFSREPLSMALQNAEIKYVFMGDVLGGRPTDDECYTDGKVDYEKVRAKDFFRHGITRLKRAYEQSLAVCLFCSEGHPSQCHRAKLIAVALSDDGIDVTHILPDGSALSQSQVIDQLTDRQTSFFEESFTSRKKYR